MTKRLEDKNKVVGAKQVKRALDADQVELVYIADDADGEITREIKEFCQEKQIQVVHVDKMKELGEACKIDISAATAALLK